MKCPTCQTNKMKIEHVARAFDLALPDIVVDGLEVGACSNCGETVSGYPRPLELSRLVVGTLIGKRGRLAPNEVSFLRGAIGLRGKGLAETLGVTPAQVSRWESGAMPISALADRLLRVLVASQWALPVPELRGIDSKRAEPVRLQIALGRKGWRVVEPVRATG